MSTTKKARAPKNTKKPVEQCAPPLDADVIASELDHALHGDESTGHDGLVSRINDARDRLHVVCSELLRGWALSRYRITASSQDEYRFSKAEYLDANITDVAFQLHELHDEVDLVRKAAQDVEAVRLVAIGKRAPRGVANG